MGTAANPCSAEEGVEVMRMMEKMAGKIPGAEYVLLQGCGHLGPMDQPDAFNDALLFFLKNHGL